MGFQSCQVEAVVVALQYHAKLLSRQRAAEHEIAVVIASHQAVFHRPFHCGLGPFRRGVVQGVLRRTSQLVLDRRAEGVHVFPMLRPPVQHVRVVGGDAQVVTFAVTDDILLCQAIRIFNFSRRTRRQQKQQ